MSVQRQEKEVAQAELQKLFSRAKAALVANYSGLNVAAVSDIRRVLREAQAEYRVVKNTLVRRVLQGTPRERLADAFSGPTAVAFKFDEEFGKLGKAVRDLAKKYGKFTVKAGFVENDILEGEKSVETMAALPSLDEVRAQLLGLLNAPAEKLLAQMNAPASHVIGVIQAKADKDKESGA